MFVYQVYFLAEPITNMCVPKLGIYYSVLVLLLRLLTYRTSRK